MLNYLEQEEVINSAWISKDGIRKLIPICKTRANQVMQDIIKEMDANGELYFNTRPRLVPTKKVINKYGFDVELIRQEASKIRNEISKQNK